MLFLILQESSEPVGEVFQDERNMAAILMRRQLENGDLLMVSTLNNEIVSQAFHFRM